MHTLGDLYNLFTILDFLVGGSHSSAAVGTADVVGRGDPTGACSMSLEESICATFFCFLGKM